MPQIEHVSIIVVGGGPTGLTIANLLGIYGSNCLLLERNEYTVREPRAVSIDDEALRTMQAIRLIDEIKPNLAVDYGSHYLDPKLRCFAKVVPQEKEYGHPRRSGFIQPELENTLRKGCERFEKVETRFSNEVLNIKQDGQKVTLEVVNDKGETYFVSCDYLVACDGGKSKIRSKIGAKLVGSTYEQQWLIIDLKGTKDAFRQTQVFCNPARPGISLPGPRGTRRFEFMLHPEETEEEILKLDSIKNLLREHGPDENAEIVRKRVYTFHARRADKWQQDRIFLAGDAAHLTPPFAGQGMNSGLRDSFNIAWKLHAVSSGKADRSLLQSYALERRDHAWRLIEMALLLGRFMMPSSRTKQWFTLLGFRILDLYAPAKRYISEMRYKPKPRFEQGFFISDQHTPKETWVGRMFPQPLLEDSMGAPCYMDDILGQGMTLIAFHKDPESAMNLFNQPFWGQQGVNRIGITPRDINPLQDNIYRDAKSEMAKAMKNYKSTFILLRPDRYVAATIPFPPTPERLDEIKNLFTQSGSVL